MEKNPLLLGPGKFFLIDANIGPVRCFFGNQKLKKKNQFFGKIGLGALEKPLLFGGELCCAKLPRGDVFGEKKKKTKNIFLGNWVIGGVWKKIRIWELFN